MQKIMDIKALKGLKDKFGDGDGVLGLGLMKGKGDKGGLFGFGLLKTGKSGGDKGPLGILPMPGSLLKR